MLQNGRHSKISQLHYLILRCKYIFRFDVSMQNSSIVQMFNAQTNLGEPCQNQVLTKILIATTLFHQFFLRRNYLAEVATLDVIHNDV